MAELLGCSGAYGIAVTWLSKLFVVVLVKQIIVWDSFD